ncbi:hypothetical protein MRS44_014147 [Fusarium solani]|uniref:uncharacterized protein n=1 Tax=Fusarium solani TaxID=169388 RepID=UPI0032C4AB3E|nr:hypothetical protein MRS44_014147 [Fusarium solani]
MTPPNTQKPSPPQKEYAFVAPHQHGARSHAMREHWRQRRHKKDLAKRQRENRPQHVLLPTPSTSEATDSQPSTETTETNPDSTVLAGGGMFDPIMFGNDMDSMMNGVPGQAMSGMNLALGSARLDPFDQFPVELTSQHHKLLHHWLSTYATMMFDDVHSQAFNPMRDVWCPLDLSNAASFNAIMAHSAAHLARMQGLRQSKEALKFKAEAVRIVQVWMDDPGRALSDDVLAAVLRLLTYEIEELSSPHLDAHLHPILGDTVNLHRIRCLWLLSFVQDVGTFRVNSPDIYAHGASLFPAIKEALGLLKLHLKQNEAGSVRQDACTKSEFTRLACLFFICILLQQSTSNSNAATDLSGHISYDAQLVSYLNMFLDSSRPQWQGSIDNLYTALFSTFDASARTGLNMEYIRNMTGVMASMTGGVRYGVERCLLNILCRTESNGFDAFDEEWTPDSLLSLPPQ